MQHRPSLLQQFLRFYIIFELLNLGLLALCCYLLEPAALFHHNLAIAQALFEPANTATHALWWERFSSAYIPYFFRQNTVVLAFCLASLAAIPTAFWFDSKFQLGERKFTEGDDTK